MSKCSKKCNEIKEKIDSISGLDDEVIYKWLLAFENITDVMVNTIKDDANLGEFNGTCFKRSK